VNGHGAFRAALRTVLPPKDLKALAYVASGFRSKIGHEALLFGAEDTFGYSLLVFPYPV
jgi:hypothetical protein